CLVDSVEDRESVGRIKRFKERLCFRVLVETGLQIVRNGDVLRRGVGTFPPTVCLCGLDRRQARRTHPPLTNQLQRLLAVELRPDATLPARRETLQPEIVVERTALSVNPAETETGFHGLCVCHGCVVGPFLRELQPDTLRTLVMCL